MVVVLRRKGQLRKRAYEIWDYWLETCLSITRTVTVEEDTGILRAGAAFGVARQEAISKV